MVAMWEKLMEKKKVDSLVVLWVGKMAAYWVAL